MSEQIPLARPQLGEREQELVAEVLASGQLSLGPMLERFEGGFAEWLGVEDVVAVSSGTAALHLGVRALGWGEGDVVVTSPLSFVASANALLYEGATPAFCDIDPVTLNIDPDLVAQVPGEVAAGLLPVHIFGYPAAMPELDQFARDAGLTVLEDACQALGAVAADGAKVGSRRNPAAFAFYPNKQMTTGEGGVIVPSSEK
ncbi:MAG: DegT/DnrJ/EryC1/StrS family aminotransferase, partial [Solirubrobacterales bacterium]